MKVNIQRVDKELPLPIYETSGSVGFDILAREEVIIQPGAIGLIPGNIIVRQKGTRYHPGHNVGLGRDYTIFAMAEGRVLFETKQGRKYVSVYPVE